MKQRRWGWGLGWVLAGCASASDGAAQPNDPEDSVESAPSAVAAAPVSADAAHVAPPVEETPPEPTWSVPTLAVAAEGHGEIGGSIVDGELVVFEHGAKVSRLGPTGEVVERLAPPGPEVDAANVDYVGGHWPAPLMYVGGVGFRDSYDNAVVVRRDDWQRPRVLKDRELTAAWAWHSDSILAATGNDGGKPRLAVLLGAPKAPKLTDIARSGCAMDHFARVAVSEQGPVVVVVSCGSSYTAAVYDRDAIVGAPFSVKGRGDTVRADIDDEGRAIVARGGRKGGRAYVRARGDGSFEETSLPPGELRAAAMDRDGVPWVAVGEDLLHLESDAWTSARPPGEGPITHLAGADAGTPWLVRDEREVYVRDPKGQWHDVAVPAPAFFVDRTFKIVRLQVEGGEAVVTAEYFVRRPGRTGATHRFAVLTTRTVDGPLRFGQYLGNMHRVNLRPWPRGQTSDCEKPMALLMAFDAWGNREYGTFRRKLRGRKDVGTPRFVEVELGEAKLFAGIVETPAQATKLVEVARRANKWTFPEVVCGDQAELDRAQAKIRREVAIDVATGDLKTP